MYILALIQLAESSACMYVLALVVTSGISFMNTMNSSSRRMDP